MPTPIESMVEALSREAEAIKKKSRTSVLELRAGIKQGVAGSDTLYSFPLQEERNLRDDSPIKIVIGTKEVGGSIVSIRNGILTIAITQDLGPQIPLARLIVDDSFLIERLRDRLQEIQQGTFKFNSNLAEAVLTNRDGRSAQADVPAAVLALRPPLNKQQERAARQSAGSTLTYVWGPPGTGKTSTLAAIAHALYLQGKSILVVSNTNVAVDVALERIGDRLCNLPEFHEAAVLRFGPIVTDSLRKKYDSRVNIDRAVERVSAVLVERHKALKGQEAEAHDSLMWYEEACKQHERLRGANQQRENTRAMGQQVLKHHESQRQELLALNSEAERTSADLKRARAMGAIGKFFSRLNENRLRRKLDDIAIRAESLQQSLQAGIARLRGLKEKLTYDSEAVAILKREMTHYPGESTCHRELAEHNQKISELAADIKSVEARIQAIRQELLGKCRVLATTIYQSYLKPEVARPFDAVIVDEASMLALPMVYYAAGLALEKVVVAGDFRQLAPILMSEGDSSKKWLKRDVFIAVGIDDAVKRNEHPQNLVALNEQFRMKEDICEVVNKFFYRDNRLTTAPAVRSRPTQSNPFAETTKGLLYVDTSDWEPWAAFRLGTYSRYNVLHALLIRNIAAKLKRNGFLKRPDDADCPLGIIAPYSAQCRLIAQLVGESLGEPGSVYAATVHRFQGSERDAVILDLTESTGARVGRFAKAQLLDEDGARLLNVALSRARECTLLIANFAFLRSKLPSAAYLRGILDHFQRQGQRLDVSDCFPFNPDEIMAGHQSATGASPIQLGQGLDGLRVFTAGTFFPAFEGDCRSAERKVVIFSPFMTERGTGRWVELWRAKIGQGVPIRLVVRPPGDQGGVLEHGLPSLIESLRRIGVAVDERTRMHEKISFIDDRILWHGSLNILSHRDTSESMLRVESPGACKQVGSFVTGRKWGKNEEDRNSARAENPTCPSCGKVMVWNYGRFGVWFECQCGQKADEYGKPTTKRRHSQQDPPAGTPPPTSTSTASTTPAASASSCPQCGAPLRHKNGRFGAFIGCSTYPRCKYTERVATKWR